MAASGHNLLIWASLLCARNKGTRNSFLGLAVAQNWEIILKYVTFRLCGTQVSKRKKYPVLLPNTSFPARVEGEKRVELDEQVRFLLMY